MEPLGRVVPKWSAGIFESPLGLLGASPEGELMADEGPVVAVDDGGQVGLDVLAYGNMGEIHGPSFVAA